MIVMRNQSPVPEENWGCRKRKANRDYKREIGRGAKGSLRKKREREHWSQEVEGKIGCAMSISTMTLLQMAVNF